MNRNKEYILNDISRATDLIFRTIYRYFKNIKLLGLVEKIVKIKSITYNPNY